MVSSFRLRADLIVNELILIELKSVEEVAPVHKKQVLTYLRITGKKLGLLINFGEATLKDGVSQIINGSLQESDRLPLCVSVPLCEILNFLIDSERDDAGIDVFLLGVQSRRGHELVAGDVVQKDVALAFAADPLGDEG